MKKLAKTLTCLLFVVFMVSAYSAGTMDDPPAESSGKYIEVCTQGTVYLPPGTKFVTCHGKVMRVVGVVRLTEMEKLMPGDCSCPECCGGICTVIVSCGGGEESAMAMGDKGDLCFAYLACGD